MSVLSLSLFGPFRATLGGESLLDFRTRKVQALLIYLATESGGHSRTHLLDLLWPGLPQSSARSNLRQILYYLRQGVSRAGHEEADDPPLFTSNRQEIRLNTENGVTVDTRRFEALLEEVQAHDHPDGIDCGPCSERLEQAVALYRGNFLPDFYLDDSDPFEEWAQGRRDHFRRRVLDALGILTTSALRRQDYAAADRAARRQIEIDRLSERGYRQLMQALALSGRRREALALYERCRHALVEGLGMSPSLRTTETYEQIHAGDLRFDDSVHRDVRGYELQESLGHGAYSAVYRALQPGMMREVAVKVIRRRHASDPRFIRRFEAEAQTVSRLEHPYIVPLYDYWRDPQGAYLVMRYLRGGSLLAALESGPWELKRAAAMLDQIADGLAFAHRHKIVHHAIKPSNILLDEAGNAYLADFGIARGVAPEPTHHSAPPSSTLDYSSPEQIAGRSVSSRSDIFSLGALLYEVLTGERPSGESRNRRVAAGHSHAPIPLVAASRPNLPPEVDTVLQRATAAAPAERYGSALEMAEAFRRAVSGASPVPVVWEAAPPPTAVVNPYKGLRAFAEADAAHFYGRDALVRHLIERMQAPDHKPEKRFLAVIGPSGSGKSSVVGAGLLAALRDGALPGSEAWFVTGMVPGREPLVELEQALWRVAMDSPPDLVEAMRRDTSGVLNVLRRVLPDTPALDRRGTQLLLVIDQFEELYTLVEEDARRDFFLDSLWYALHAPRSPLRLIVTLRADFYDRPLNHPDWGSLFKQQSEIVLPLNRSELTWAVREPARTMGVRLEEGLVADIVADVDDQPGALPLLQYTLTELFERREGSLITHSTYGSLGGVRGALARRAEAEYAALDDRDKQLAKQLFLRLIALGEGTEDTRRRVLRAELDALGEGTASEVAAPVALLLDRFGAARFLTFDRDPLSRAPTVEVAHEALIREWPRLRAWLDESRDDLRQQRLLSQATTDWLDSGQDSGFLLRGARLDQFADWVQRSTVVPAPDEVALIEASVAARVARRATEEERRRRELKAARDLAETQEQRALEQGRAARRLRRLVGALAAVLLVAVALGWVANRQRAVAQASFIDAERVRLASQAQIALDRGEGGELPALLALRSLALGYSPEGDAALQGALRRGFSRQRYLGHADVVTGASFAPDGRTLQTPSRDGTVRLWDTQSGEERARLVGHSGPLWGAIHSPDGRLILSSSHDGTARLWDVETRTEIRRFEHDDVATAASFSPDGRSALTASGTTLYLWDTATGALLRRLEGHSAQIFAAEFSPDGKTVASAGMDNTVRLWDLASGTTIRELRGHSGWIGEVKFSPDGRYVVSASADRTARIWNVESGIELQRLVGHTDEIFTSTFSPDGRLVATGSRDRTARLWDPQSGEELRQILGHTGAVFARFSPDGRHLVTSSEDRSARLWDVDAVSEPQALVSSGTGHSVHQSAAAIAPDGSRVLTDDGTGTLGLWIVSTSKRVDSFPIPGETANRLAFSAGGTIALVAASGGIAYVVDVGAAGAGIALEGHEGEVLAGAIAADDRWALTGGEDGTVRLWDIPGAREVNQYQGHVGAVRGVALASDGRRLLTGGDDGTLILWDRERGTEIHRLEGGAGRVLDVAIAPDNRTLAAAHADGTAVLWDAESGRQRHRLVGHSDQVSRLVFSPDGRTLLTGSVDQTARLWDVRTGALLRQIVGHESPLLLVGFSEDGERIYTADQEAVLAWHTSLDALSALACDQLPRDFTPEERAFYDIRDDVPTCATVETRLARAEPTWTPIATDAIAPSVLTLASDNAATDGATTRGEFERRYTISVDDIRDMTQITPIEGTRADLLVSDRGVTFQIYTVGLTPGHAYTAWLMVINHPQYCSDGVCGPDDAFPPPGNEEAGASVRFGDGLVVDESGEGYFTAHFPAGVESPPWSVGLTNPEKAEIHFILRDHGPALPDLVYEQTTTADAACNNFGRKSGTYTCLDVQAGRLIQP